jgi:hypothetical protein
MARRPAPQTSRSAYRRPSSASANFPLRLGLIGVFGAPVAFIAWSLFIFISNNHSLPLEAGFGLAGAWVAVLVVLAIIVWKSRTEGTRSLAKFTCWIGMSLLLTMGFGCGYALASIPMSKIYFIAGLVLSLIGVFISVDTSKMLRNDAIWEAYAGVEPELQAADEITADEE